jgi:hypothetical protein
MKKIIKFFIDDFKSDLDWFKKGCPIKKELKDNFKFFLKYDFWLETLKDNWLTFLLVIIAFLTGMFLAYILAFNHYNNFIFNEVLPNCYYWQRAYDFPGKEKLIIGFTK